MPSSLGSGTSLRAGATTPEPWLGRGAKEPTCRRRGAAADKAMAGSTKLGLATAAPKSPHRRQQPRTHAAEHLAGTHRPGHEQAGGQRGGRRHRRRTRTSQGHGGRRHGDGSPHGGGNGSTSKERRAGALGRGSRGRAKTRWPRMQRGREEEAEMTEEEEMTVEEKKTEADEDRKGGDGE